MTLAVRSARASDRADRTNRVVFSILGVLLVVVAAAALATSFGALGDDARDRVVVTDAVVEDLQDWYRWLWAAVGVACALLALLALRWAWRQLVAVPPSGEIVVDDGSDGFTVVTGEALIDALSHDLDRLDDVVSSRAAVVDGAEHVQVLTTVVDPNSARDLHRDVVQGPADRLRTTVGKPSRLEVEVRLADRPRPRVN